MSPNDLSETRRQEERRFYGKYRGLVTDNQDPLLVGVGSPTVLTR